MKKIKVYPVACIIKLLRCGKKSFWALTQLQQKQSRVKKGFLYFRY